MTGVSESAALPLGNILVTYRSCQEEHFHVRSSRSHRCLTMMMPYFVALSTSR